MWSRNVLSWPLAKDQDASAGPSPVGVAVEPDATPQTALGPVVARFTGLNALLMLLALVTGPIQARILGPEGRGEIAVILAVLTMAPILLDFGLSAYVARERARGTSLGTLLATVLPLALGFSMLGVLAAVPVSELLGQGRPVVERYLLITLFAMPLWVGGGLLLAAARGEQRWAILYRQRAFTVISSTAAIVGLAVLGVLTVESLAVAMLAITIPGLAFALPMLRGVGPLRVERALVRPALAFGSRSWVTLLSAQGNYRLDQLVMAAVVSSRELGFYAVAVSFTAVVSSFVNAVSLALMPRVAQQGGESVPQVVRVSTLALACGLAALAALSPVAVPLLFGNEFRSVVPLVSILVVGALFIGISLILGSALQGHGRPQDAMRPQLVGLVVTVVGLAIVLGPLGALGAALVSVLAYAAVLAGTVRAAVREFGVPPSALLMPRAEDVHRLVRVVQARRRGRR